MIVSVFIFEAKVVARDGIFVVETLNLDLRMGLFII